MIKKLSPDLKEEVESLIFLFISPYGGLIKWNTSPVMLYNALFDLLNSSFITSNFCLLN